MAIDEKVQNQNGVMRKINNSFQNSKLYKGIAGALGALALTYAVNTADISGKVNTAYAEESAEASAQPYKEMHIEDEYNFKDKIADSGLCWVMYTFDGVKPEHKKRGDYFWEKLQEEFGDQVDAYIVIDTTNWDADGKDLSQEEIGKDKYPSFILYNEGKIIEGDKGYPVQIAGVPKEGSLNEMITYMKSNTILD